MRQVVKMLNAIAGIGPRIVAGRDAGLHASGHSYRCCPEHACAATAPEAGCAVCGQPC